ncbi:MAG: amphi-Trp domain-containing protein [Planctomycetes bacterium]|nr:amphi-Trp domain-containing protein [Planctomycetota bacterium]
MAKRRNQMVDDEFSHESLQDAKSISKYLGALMEGFESGSIELGSAEQTMVLKPQGLLDFEIRAKKSGSRSRVSLKLSWREDSDKKPPKNLKIKS